MKTRDKEEAALRRTEAKLCDLLRRTLPRAAETGWDAFCNSRFDPFGIHSNDGPTEELLALALAAQDLRARLGHPESEGPAYLYIRSCEERADLSNPHRLGPRRLAQRLLAELSTA